MERNPNCVGGGLFLKKPVQVRATDKIGTCCVLLYHVNLICAAFSNNIYMIPDSSKSGGWL